MNTSPDNTVAGSLELHSLTAITHAADEQKNRNPNQKQRRRKAKPKRAKSPGSGQVSSADATIAQDDQAEGHQVDYLA